MGEKVVLSACKLLTNHVLSKFPIQNVINIIYLRPHDFFSFYLSPLKGKHNFSFFFRRNDP